MYDLAAIVSRVSTRQFESDGATSDRQAAVAAILRAPRNQNEAEILLIRRSEREGDPWSGHMAFPGGRHEASDPSLLVTALRETQEEVGLDLERRARLITRLPSIPAMTRAKHAGIIVTPFIFALEDPDHPEFLLSGEVAETLWAPIGPMVRGENATTFPYRHEGVLYQLPAYSIDGRIVWGLTHRMLQMFFELLT